MKVVKSSQSGIDRITAVLQEKPRRVTRAVFWRNIRPRHHSRYHCSSSNDPHICSVSPIELIFGRIGSLLAGVCRRRANIAGMEKRNDMLISTLDKTVESLGGTLKLLVEFPDRPPVFLTGLGDLLEGAKEA